MNDETSALFTVVPFRRGGDSAARAETEEMDTRPLIRIESSNLEAVVDQAEEALIEADRGLYQRGNAIVIIAEVKILASDEREVLAKRICERGDFGLLEDLCASAAFEKYDKRSRGCVIVEPPMKVVKVLKDRNGLRLPILSGVVNAPTLRRDGSILDRPGYDPATGLVFDPGEVEFQPIPEKPSRDEAMAALDTLSELLATFPFVSEADRSVALSALLSAPVRRSMRTCPLHALTAPVIGSGKSTLVDMVSIIATGRECGVISQGKTGEEFEKRLGAKFLAGDPIVSIDNVEDPLGGDFICSALTQTSVSIRILGQSKSVELPTGAFLMATGNNLQIVGDLTRRVLVGKLDPKVERPELRTFDSNPIEVAKSQRVVFVSAILTVLRAFIAAGKPRQADPLGSFEDWSDLVRGALLWLGRADPVATMEATRDSDPQLDALRTVASQWFRVIGSERVSARAVIDKAVEKTSPNAFEGDQTSFTRPDFRDALLTVAGQGGAVNSKKLGHWLKQHADRVISITTEEADEWDRPDKKAETRKLRFTQVGLISGIMTWRLDNMRALQQPEF